MGRKKKRTVTSKNTKSKRRRQMNLDTEVVIMFLVSILSAVLIYFKSGYVGEALSNILGGIFGIAKYLIPIVSFAIAINLIDDNKEYLIKKIMQYGVIVCCICTIFSIYQIAIPQNLHVELGLSNVVERAYDIGTLNKGGGVIGCAIAYPLIKLLGVAGTVILAIGLSIVFIVFMFGFKPTEFLAEIIGNIREKRNERYNENEVEPNKPEEVVETRRERRLREKEEQRLKALEVDQLKINLDNNENVTKNNENIINSMGLKKENIFGKQDPDFIETNLFKQEEQKKEDNTKEVLQLEHGVVVEDEHYEYPPINLLSKNTKKATKAGAKALTDTAAKLQKTLYSFGVSAKVENVTVGPAITRYELKPAEGVRVSKIANLADDIALNLAAETLRIEAPIPGKQAVRN